MHPTAEDFDLYQEHRLSDLQTAAMEAHLAVCDLCAAKLAGKVDRRHEPRTARQTGASMQVLHPLSMDNIEVRLCNVSRIGMAVRCRIFVAPGSEVKIRVGDTISFGQVRYCVEVDDEFQAGIRIRDIF